MQSSRRSDASSAHRAHSARSARREAGLVRRAAHRVALAAAARPDGEHRRVAAGEDGAQQHVARLAPRALLVRRQHAVDLERAAARVRLRADDHLRAGGEDGGARLGRVGLAAVRRAEAREAEAGGGPRGQHAAGGPAALVHLFCAAQFVISPRPFRPRSATCRRSASWTHARPSTARPNLTEGAREGPHSDLGHCPCKISSTETSSEAISSANRGRTAAHPPKICSVCAARVRGSRSLDTTTGLDIRPPRRLTSLVALGGDDTAVRRGRRPVN